MYILNTIVEPGKPVLYWSDGNHFVDKKGNATPVTFEKAQEIIKNFDFNLNLEKID